MIGQLGGKSMTLGFVGGCAGKQLSDGLHAEGIETDFVWLAEESRTNFSIVTTSGDRYLKVNEAGPVVSAAEQTALIEKVLSVTDTGDWCVLGGSLPPGVSTEFYADLIERLNEIGVRTILDTSGEPLRAGCAAGPFLITPNLAEASEIANQAEPDATAQTLRELGPENVVVTLGSDGAFLLDEDGPHEIKPPAIEERNAIGAGDALVGGVVFGLQNDLALPEALRWGVACGTAAASLAGTAFGNRSAVEAMLERM